MKKKKNYKWKCRVCGCTDNDCRKCIEKTGGPCYWVDHDLCSACDPGSSTAEAKKKNAKKLFKRISKLALLLKNNK